MFAYIKNDNIAFLCVQSILTKNDSHIEIVKEKSIDNITGKETMIEKEVETIVTIPNPSVEGMIEMEYDENIIHRPSYDKKTNTIIDDVPESEIISKKKEAKMEEFIIAQDITDFDWE